jgi:hypothetical protein
MISSKCLNLAQAHTALVQKTRAQLSTNPRNEQNFLGSTFTTVAFSAVPSEWKWPTVPPALTDPEMSDWLGKYYRNTNEMFSTKLCSQMCPNHHVTVAQFPLHHSAGDVVDWLSVSNTFKHQNCPRLLDTLCRVTFVMKAMRIMMPLDFFKLIHGYGKRHGEFCAPYFCFSY